MATAGGHDRAYLHDSSSNDTFYADPTEASLYNPTYRSSSPSLGQVFTGFYNRAKFFEEVYGYSVAGGRDTARLFGSDQDDVFTSDPTKAVLANAAYQESYTHGFSNEARSFERVYANAGEGDDAATLLDAANEVDLLTAQGISARLSCQALDLIYEAAGFDRVQATSRTSGDKKSVSKTDPPQFFLDLEGVWQDLA